MTVRCPKCWEAVELKKLTQRCPKCNTRLLYTTRLKIGDGTA